MSPYVLDALIWILGIRGHIPQHDDFRAASGGTSPGAATGSAIRILAATVVSLAFLALVLWAAVWLAIRCCSLPAVDLAIRQPHSASPARAGRARPTAARTISQSR